MVDFAWHWTGDHAFRTPGDCVRNLAAIPLYTQPRSVCRYRLAYDPARGSLKEVQTISTLPDNFTGGKSGAEVAVHPSGKFVYASNRGHDTIAAFAIDQTTGKLTSLQHQSTLGKTPRHFAIDPGGTWLLAENQASDSIVSFHLDSRTGRLSDSGQLVSVPSPVCLVFVHP